MAQDPELIGLPSMVYMFGFPTATNVFWIKIGRSLNPLDRMKSLQAGCPFEFQLLFLNYGDRAEEMRLHNEFKQWRACGEWFRMSREFAQAALDDLNANKDIRIEATKRTREYRELNRHKNIMQFFEFSMEMAQGFCKGISNE